LERIEQFHEISTKWSLYREDCGFFVIAEMVFVVSYSTPIIFLLITNGIQGKREILKHNMISILLIN
jgi:hypothetical protein